MTFTQLINQIARYSVISKGFWEMIRAAGIFPNDWPNGIGRSLLEKYEELRKQNSHEFASFELQSAANMIEQESIPLEPSALKVLYQQEKMIFDAINLTSEIIKNPEQVMEIVNNFKGQTKSRVETKSLSEVIDLTYQSLSERIKSNNVIAKIPGWELLSEAIGGFNGSRTGILMADTGFGKTNFALNLALCAQRKFQSLYINMEMCIDDIGSRIFCIAGETTFKNIVNGSIPALDKTYLATQGVGLEFTTGRDLSVPEISALVRQKSREQKTKFVVVDYDQKLELKLDKTTPEWKALQTAMIDLESIAKELGLYILVLAQTNDEGQISGSRRSTFPASTVMRFFEDEDLGPVIAATFKNRFGPIGEGVRVQYIPEASSVKELERINVRKAKNDKRRTL